MRSGDLRRHNQVAAFCKACIRSSSGGWLLSSRLAPSFNRSLMPKAVSSPGISCGRDCSGRRRASAAIMAGLLARLAPAASARYSRQREKHIAIIEARKLKIICAITVVIHESSYSTAPSRRSKSAVGVPEVSPAFSSLTRAGLPRLPIGRVSAASGVWPRAFLKFTSAPCPAKN